MTRSRRPASAQRSLRGSSQVRLRIGLIVLAMVISLFGARLVQLQGLDPQAYAAKADAEGLVTVPLRAERGEITDRNGVALAESVSGVMLVADPLLTARHAQRLARLLANRLGIDYVDTLQRLRKSGSRYQRLARRVPSERANRIMAAAEKAGLLGLQTYADPLRSYPAGDVGANLLGFIGGEGKPMGGLELSFNDLLRGKDGLERYEVGGGNRIPLGENTEVKPVNGRDLTLTIDRDVQWYAQRVLREAVQKANAESGAVVALDTRTGELMALADYPTFNANDAADAARKDLGSRALSDVYEPGSVQKVLTTAGLIDAGRVTPRTRITVPHELPVADRVIHDYFDHPTIRLTLAGVVAKSSNIGTVLATTGFNTEKMWSYLDLFGLGHRIDIGLSGVTRGLVPDGRTWSRLTQATIAFGQGISVNALQMASAVNAVANGGEYISPSLVEGRATTDSGTDVGTATSRRHRVVSPKAARSVARMMEMVTTEGAGTAPMAGIPGYRVAGKTGTAQQVGARCKCYDGSLAVSFAGFAPADHPRFTVYVVIQRPKAAASGGGTAGPVFRKILSYLLQKYAVPPTGTPPADIPVEW